MPAIKKIISDYFHTHCKRQLYFNIHNDVLPDHIARAIQQNVDNNKIVQKLLESGREWEKKKFDELSQCFNKNVTGRQSVVDDRRENEKGRSEYEDLAKYLMDRFPRYHSGTFIFEPEIALPETFIERMQLRESMDFVTKYLCRPDILELLPERLPDSHEPKFRRYLTPDGSVRPMDEYDDRQRLRVIDIKLLSQTSPSYFAEVTLYSMILACWLRDKDLDSEYVVVPNAAIWPGSYTESHLHRVYGEQEDNTPARSLWLAMQDDLEEAPIEAFVGPIRQFFRQTVPEVLNMTPRQCDEQVCVTSRCRGCLFLEGLRQYDYGTKNTDDPENKKGDEWSFFGCRDLAQRTGHLSLVPDISEGTITLFRDEFGVEQTYNLLELTPQRIAASDSKYIKSRGRITMERAKMIEQARTQAKPPPARLMEDTGTTCDMSKKPDVHVYLNTNYDFVHLITLSLAMRVADTTGKSNDYIWSFENDDIKQEGTVFARFCQDVADVLEKHASSSIQFYFWDKTQYEHFQRLVERHHECLENDPRLTRVMFLTPPENVLPNPTMETWQSPRTIVSEVLAPRLVAPIPYHYNLLNTARCFHDSSKTAADFTMPELTDEIFGGSLSFEEGLSSQIPSDRIYDLWNLSRKDDDASIEARLNLLQAIDKAVEIQLDALESITKRLQSDMEPTLFSLPPQAQRIQAPEPAPIAADSKIWLRFSQLDSNAAEREIKQIHSLSSVEKEVQCESVRIIAMLNKEERKNALEQLELSYDPNSNMPLVCRLSPDSCEAKFKEDDFTCAIAPVDNSMFLSSPVRKYTQRKVPYWIKTMSEITSVNIKAIDRGKHLIVLAPATYPRVDERIDILRDLMIQGIIDPKNFLVEKIATDFFMDKFHRVVTAIGNPPEAVENSVSKKLGYTDPIGMQERPVTESTPASKMIWDAKILSETPIKRNMTSIFNFLNEKKIVLNESQHQAVEHALCKRLSLLWGPPGTGKSKTLCAIALGAIHDAVKNGRPLRMLITGPTNTAIDNVLDELDRLTDKYFSDEKKRNRIRCARFKSSPKPNRKIPELSAGKLDFTYKKMLCEKQGILIVGSTPQQVYKLCTENNMFRCGDFFDLVLLDEASQVEVSQAFLVYSTLAENASLVIAGDPLQMPPIQQAGIPQGLKPMLGSVYDYYAHEKTWGIRPCELLVNYRSNAAIVNLAREANYPPALKSEKSGLAIRLKNESDKSHEPWLTRLVDPTIAVCAFVHKDGKSNQSNPFEAMCIEKIVQYLREHLYRTLANDGNTPLDEHHTNETFWSQGVGIVTPHRAQQALIVNRLENVFCKNKSKTTAKLKNLIRDAVDTVERFQGQQRDVIIISFGMGDRDAIKKEEEFLMSLNRFNVMTSRARAKLILFLSEELVHYVPEDVEVQKQSRLLKAFTDVYCNCTERLDIATQSGIVEGRLIFYQDPGILETEIPKEVEISQIEPAQSQPGITYFKRGDKTNFEAMFGDGFFDAKKIWISDRYLHCQRHFFAFMEFIKTIHHKKQHGGVKISVSTVEHDPCNYSDKSYTPQDEYIKQSISAAKSVGIELEFSFKTKKEKYRDHAREIKTDHGWKILLDRGFDMFDNESSRYKIQEHRIFNMSEKAKNFKTLNTYIIVEPPGFRFEKNKIKSCD